MFSSQQQQPYVDPNFGDNSIKKYEKMEKLGEGTYGKVYKSRDKDRNDIVALKKMTFEVKFLFICLFSLNFFAIMIFFTIFQVLKKKIDPKRRNSKHINSGNFIIT